MVPKPRAVTGESLIMRMGRDIVSVQKGVDPRPSHIMSYRDPSSGGDADVYIRLESPKLVYATAGWVSI